MFRRSFFHAFCGVTALVAIATVSLSAQAFIRDPWIQDVTETTVSIRWEATQSGGTQELHWGATAGTLDHVVVGQLVSDKLYAATVTGLDTSTSWHYQVVSGGEQSVPGTFVTATCKTEPFVFVADGDNRDGVADHQAIVDAILQYAGAPDFTVNTGDIVNGTDYLEYFDVEKTLLKDVPIFPSPGNHDNTAEYQYGFDRPLYYAFDYGNARFIALNTNSLYGPGTAEGDWLANEMQQAQARKASGDIDWIFVFHHHPAYSSGTHGNSLGVGIYLVPVYEQYGVDVVINGHDHDYERSIVNGITYIVTGGGGVGTRSVTCDTGNGCVFAQSVHHFTQFTVDGKVLTIRAIDKNGNTIDSTEISHGPRASGDPCNATAGDHPTTTIGDPTYPGIRNDKPGDGGDLFTPGCACAVGGRGPASGAAALLLLAALGLVAVRRRG